jgi:hypothetical protein
MIRFEGTKKLPSVFERRKNTSCSSFALQKGRPSVAGIREAGLREVEMREAGIPKMPRYPRFLRQAA